MLTREREAVDAETALSTAIRQRDAVARAPGLQVSAMPVATAHLEAHLEAHLFHPRCVYATFQSAITRAAQDVPLAARDAVAASC